MKYILWNIYRIIIILSIGYISIILGIFTTDDPRGSGVIGGIFVALLIFVISYTMIVLLPIKIYKFLTNKRIK